MSRFQFAWFRRWRKWIAAVAITAVLPILSFLYLNQQRTALIEELRPTSVGATPWASPFLNPVFTKLAINPADFPYLLWKINVPDPIQIETDLTPGQMRRVVNALNRVGDARSVQLVAVDAPLNTELLIPLIELEDLERLELTSWSGNQGDIVAILAEIRGLRELSLTGSDVTAAEIRRLDALPQLERLEIAGAGNSGGVLVAISDLPNLREVRLDRSFGLDAEDLGPLASLPRLERLSVVECTRQMETIDGSFERVLIPTFQSLPALKELRIGSRGGFPADRVAKLREALPEVNVIVVDTRLDPGYSYRRW